MVRAPVLSIVASEERVAKRGATPVEPMKICPLVPALVTWTAPVPLPTRTPLEVKVVAPVPPLATGSVPVTSVVRSTLAPRVEAIVIVPLPLVTVIPAP